MGTVSYLVHLKETRALNGTTDVTQVESGNGTDLRKGQGPLVTPSWKPDRYYLGLLGLLGPVSQADGVTYQLWKGKLRCLQGWLRVKAARGGFMLRRSVCKQRPHCDQALVILGESPA